MCRITSNIDTRMSEHLPAVGVAIIGAGRMGSLHARTFASLRGVSVRVVCDPDEARGREVAALVGADWTPSVGPAVERSDVAAVSICTPDHLHRAPCLDAI